jgi:hypothetical protein
MPANDPLLVALTAAAIGLMLFLILALKLHASLALMLSSMGYAEVSEFLGHSRRFPRYAPS